MIIYIKNKHTLKIDDFTFKCCIGKGGISKEKKEGDKKHLLVRIILNISILEKIKL